MVIIQNNNYFTNLRNILDNHSCVYKFLRVVIRILRFFNLLLYNSSIFVDNRVISNKRNFIVTFVIRFLKMVLFYGTK